MEYNYDDSEVDVETLFPKILQWNKMVNTIDDPETSPFRMRPHMKHNYACILMKNVNRTHSSESSYTCYFFKNNTLYAGIKFDVRSHQLIYIEVLYVAPEFRNSNYGYLVFLFFCKVVMKYHQKMNIEKNVYILLDDTTNEYSPFDVSTYYYNNIYAKLGFYVPKNRYNNEMTNINPNQWSSIHQWMKNRHFNKNGDIKIQMRELSSLRMITLNELYENVVNKLEKIPVQKRMMYNDSTMIQKGKSSINVDIHRDIPSIFVRE
jgi:hypothetical protein